MLPAAKGTFNCLESWAIRIAATPPASSNEVMAFIQANPHFCLPKNVWNIAKKGTIQADRCWVFQHISNSQLS